MKLHVFAVCGVVIVAWLVGCQSTPRFVDSPWKNQKPSAAQLKYIEHGRKKVSGRTVVEYTIMAEELAGTGPYVLWMRRADLSAGRVGSYRMVVAPDGKVTIDAGVPASLAYTLQDMARGEPFENALVTPDGDPVAFGKIIPLPLEAEGAGGRYRIELEFRDHQIYLARYIGFEPGETITIISKSGNEENIRQEVVRDDITVYRMILPAVIGQTGGMASHTVIGKHGSVSIEYPWGTAVKIE